MNEEYDLTIHLQQQTENLLQQRASGNISGFDWIWQGIEKIIGTPIDKQDNEQKGKDLIRDTVTKVKAASVNMELSDADRLAAVINEVENYKINQDNMLRDYMDEIVDLLFEYIKEANRNIQVDAS